MLLKILKQILHFFIVILILIFLFIFFLLIGTPIYTWRFIVTKLAACFRSDLGKILQSKSSICGTDDITSCPKQSLVIFNTAKGTFDINDSINMMISQGVLVKDPITSNLTLPDYPEAQQYVTDFLGFKFWKWDEDFNIYNHVKYYIQPGESVTEEEFHSIGVGLTFAPFPSKRSPWEILIFPNITVDKDNYKLLDNVNNDEEDSKYCGIITHVHHTIGDGFALLKVLIKTIAGKDKLDVAKPQFVPIQSKLSLCTKLYRLFKSPYDLISEILYAADPINDWHVPEPQLQRKVNSVLSPLIPMSYIKDIKNGHHCSFTTVLISAFTGAIRKFMIEAGRDKNIPKKIHCVHPLPMPGHPDKLRNHMTACFVELPISIINPKQRLLAIEENMIHAKNSTFYPIAFFHYLTLLGGLTSCMMKNFSKNNLCTAFMSNMPGDNNEMVVLGHKVTSMFFSGGFTPGNIGMGFASISYNGCIRIIAGLDEGIVSKKTLPANDTFIKYFMEELDELKKEIV